LRQFEHYRIEQNAEPTAMRFLGAVEAAIVQVLQAA